MEDDENDATDRNNMNGHAFMLAHMSLCVVFVWLGVTGINAYACQSEMCQIQAVARLYICRHSSHLADFVAPRYLTPIHSVHLHSPVMLALLSNITACNTQQYVYSTCAGSCMVATLLKALALG